MIRLPDGQEIMATHSAGQSLAADEEANWVDLWHGSRLPKRIAISGEDDDGERGGGQTTALAELCGGLSGLRPEEPPLKTREEWQEPYPRKSAVHWRKEDLSGQRLVGLRRSELGGMIIHPFD